MEGFSLTKLLGCNVYSYVSEHHVQPIVLQVQPQQASLTSTSTEDRQTASAPKQVKEPPVLVEKQLVTVTEPKDNATALPVEEGSKGDKMLEVLEKLNHNIETLLEKDSLNATNAVPCVNGTNNTNSSISTGQPIFFTGLYVYAEVL